MGSIIHETAIVENGAELGANVSVGPFCHISSGATVGDDCRIGDRCSIMGTVKIGKGCRLHAGCFIGDTPQDVGFEGGESSVEIGSGCIIREGVTIHRGTKPGTVTSIGDNCFLMAFSHCAHNVALGDRVVIANSALLGGYVEVGSRAFVSGNVCVHQFVRVGKLAMLGGNCSVNKDVPPFMIVKSASLNTVGGVNFVGLKRAGIEVGEREQIKEAYSLLYRSGLNVAQAVEKIRTGLSGEAAGEIADFIEVSKRGICVRVS